MLGCILPKTSQLEPNHDGPKAGLCLSRDFRLITGNCSVFPESFVALNQRRKKINLRKLMLLEVKQNLQKTSYGSINLETSWLQLKLKKSRICYLISHEIAISKQRFLFISTIVHFKIRMVLQAKKKGALSILP